MRHPAIKAFYVGNNLFSDISCEYFADLIRRNSSIIDLNISNKWPDEKIEISKYQQHPHITHVGIKFISDVLANTIISSEVITKNGKQTKHNTPLIDSENSKIKINVNRLHVLCVSHQRIGDIGACYLFSALPFCHLLALNLCSNHLTDNCCLQLSICLSNLSTRLQKIDLSCNKVFVEYSLSTKLI